ncbi:MAG: HAD family hydrolase [Candidatus Micrarchaeaceae archaeon]
MIKLIIFDVGGVIDTFDEKYYVRYLSQKFGIDGKRFESALIPLLDKMEIGQLSLKEMKARLSKMFGMSISELEWESAFTKLNRVNKDVVKLMGRLFGKYTIAILTNVSRSRHLMKMEQYLGSVKCDRVFTSCYLRMRKPEHRIYRFVLKSMKARPGETIFIDNLEKNVKGAEEVGIKTIRFVGYKDMVKRLRSFGVKC